MFDGIISKTNHNRIIIRKRRLLSLTFFQFNLTSGPTMEQHQKKIAIVLPVYNMEEFLSECIDSILSQTYTNFDIFAVDDASTDSSLEILYRYQKKRLSNSYS